MIVNVVYEAGTLRLLEPLNLTEGTHLAVTLNEAPLQQRVDAALLLTLPRAERNRLLAAAAAAAPPAYEDDLALPIADRELTAFTALDGEMFLDHQGDNHAAWAEARRSLAGRYGTDRRLGITKVSPMRSR